MHTLRISLYGQPDGICPVGSVFYVHVGSLTLPAELLNYSASLYTYFLDINTTVSTWHDLMALITYSPNRPWEQIHVFDCSQEHIEKLIFV